MKCPLCGGQAGRTADVVDYDEVWKALADQFGASFSKATIERHTPAATTILRECEQCGLQYFAPAVPGDAEFYRTLMAALPYERDRWEFDRILERIRGVTSIIDLGCGDGAFLSEVRKRESNARIVGVDWNEEAVARLRSRGIEAYGGDLSTRSELAAERFEVVCALQVLEHVPDPTTFVELARSILAPNGRLFLAVPNRHRTTRASCEPLDCPPHHLTRWDEQPFKYLATSLGLVVERVMRAPPDITYEYQPYIDSLTRRLSWLGSGAASFFARATAALRVPSLIRLVTTPYLPSR
jgi:2-polyprenyl-3-methyl-5-hydroxy-6-metoxy-1,4-benzoquinol methylase